MVDISHSIVIARPIDDVFHFVSNLENDHYWWKAVLTTKKLTAGAVGPGTEFDQLSKVLFVTVHNHLRITVWQPPTLCRYVNESKQLAYTVDYIFSSEGSQTRYTLKADLELKGVLKWLLPLTLSTLHSQLDRYFSLLKQHLESSAQ